MLIQLSHPFSVFRDVAKCASFDMQALKSLCCSRSRFHRICASVHAFIFYVCMLVILKCMCVQREGKIFCGIVMQHNNNNNRMTYHAGRVQPLKRPNYKVRNIRGEIEKVERNTHSHTHTRFLPWLCPSSLSAPLPHSSAWFWLDLLQIHWQLRSENHNPPACVWQ